MKKGNGFSAAMSIPTRYSDPSRILAGSRTFFVTSSISEKRNLLQPDRSAGLFIGVLYEYREQNKCHLHEFVVMPDHFHLLLTVDSSMTIEKAVQLIKVDLRLAPERNWVFERRFGKGDSELRINEGEAYSRVAEYIRNNPVERGLAWIAEGSPYSSAFPGFEVDPAPQG
jgi:putative transposase